MFLNPFPNAFGLDIGDRSINVVQLHNLSRRRKGRSYDVAVCRTTKLPKGLIVNGIIEQPEKVRKYLMHVLYDGQDNNPIVNSQWVVASVPDAQSFIKRIDIDKRATDIIEEDVIEASRRHIPFGEDAYYTDWQIMTDHVGEKTSVLVAAVPKRIADSYIYLLESIGLGVIALELEAIALCRALITAGKPYTNEARGVLNLGASRSSFTVYDHDQIQFSVSLPFSGELLTETIADACRISYDEAEKKKIAIGLEYTQQDERCWASAVKKITTLAGEIHKAMEFYATHFSNANPITHITMCGGSSAMKRLDRVLSQKLRTTARPGHVWKNLASKKPSPCDEEASLHYAVGVGLALRAAANPFFAHDLL